MAKPCLSTLTIILSIFLFTVTLLSPDAEAGTRIKGDIGVRGYGYVDAADEDHLWILQSTRLIAYMPEKSLAMHFSADWIGDSQDDFGESSRFRFLKGYVDYGRTYSKTKAKLGRFFQYRGVAVGILDGIDLSIKLKRNLEVSAFGGIMSPLTREFEFKSFADAFSFGGEIKYRWLNSPVLDRSHISLSYAKQTRNDQVVRHRTGLAFTGRRGANWKFSGYLHIRPQGSLLRKTLLRARYATESYQGYLEGGIFNPDIEDYSWFKDFGHGTYYRIRYSFGKWISEAKWFYGLNGSLLLKGGETGVRLGPIFTSPYGSAGYNYTTGELGSSDGPWIALNYTASGGFEVFANWSRVSYEWEAFELDENEFTTTRLGGSYRPGFFRAVTMSGEYQIYKTPQFDKDRRALLGLKWQFDTAGGSK